MSDNTMIRILDQIDFSKNADGLIPAVIQDASTRKVLMQGYMNEAAVKETFSSEKVTFYSRSKQRLWTKGERSENFLLLRSMSLDCDNDSLLVQAQPQGPTCHTGADTCWSETNEHGLEFLTSLAATIKGRRGADTKESYTSYLFSKGIPKIAQKVGEESVELIIDAVKGDKERFLEESADMMYHFLVLLEAQDLKLEDVVQVLAKRDA